jgi:hypothetical protein
MTAWNSPRSLKRSQSIWMSFLDRYVELINLSASGQLAMRKMFEEHLARVE